jgi:hypothetical protein
VLIHIPPRPTITAPDVLISIVITDVSIPSSYSTWPVRVWNAIAERQRDYQDNHDENRGKRTTAEACFVVFGNPSDHSCSLSGSHEEPHAKLEVCLPLVPIV